MENSLLFLDFIFLIGQLIQTIPTLKMNSSDRYLPTNNINKFVYINELEMAKEIMKREDEYIIQICGAAGSGKTSFLSLLRNELGDNSARGIINCGVLRGDFYHRNSMDDLSGYFINLLNLKDPLLIDEIECLVNPNEFISQLINHGKRKIIVTTRKTTVLSDLGFNYIITLNPLSYEQFLKLFYELAIDSNMVEAKYPSLLDNFVHHLFDQATSITPRDVVSGMIDISHSSNSVKSLNELFLSNKHLLYQYGKGIDLSSKIIIPQKQIITPPKDIVTEVTVLDKKLLERVKMDPLVIDELSPREFEEMVCDLLDAQGYTVELTPQTRDGGKDIIVTQKTDLGDFCIYVECKKYDRSNPVRVKLIRELYGTVMADNVTAGLMVTTSYYTKDAYEYRETVKNRIHLKDYQDLIYDISKLKS